MPRNFKRSTSPSNPSSAISTLLPPARTKTFSPCDDAQSSASRISSTLVASMKYFAGPPMPRVVKGARGTLRRTNATLSLLLAAACLVAFAPAFTAGVTNWDDDLYVRAPESQRISAGTFTHFVFGSFHPLTIFSFAIEQQLFGRNAFLLHATNVVLHAASAVLLFFLLQELGAVSFGAFAGALLWAIHPLRVESVVWIAERKDVLCTLFFVAALIAYGRRRLMLTFALFALALLSKGMAVTFPLAMLSVDYLQRRKALLEKIPFFAMSAAFAAIGFAGQQPKATVTGLPLVCQTFLSYLGKVFLPIRLNAIYLYPHRILWWSVPAAIAVVIIAFATRVSGFAMLFFVST